MNGLNLETLPEPVGNFPKVMVLNLAGNELHQVPDIFSSFPKLKVLNLQDNPLSDEDVYSHEAFCSEKGITLQTNTSEKNNFRRRPTK